MAEIIEDKALPPQHTEDYRKTVYKCGINRDHLVRIHRSKWPPREGGNVQTGEKHFVAAQCERCGGNALVYDPPSRDMTVVLYGEVGDIQGRVLEEGQVVDEADVPPTGQVVDEPRSPRRR